MENSIFSIKPNIKTQRNNLKEELLEKYFKVNYEQNSKIMQNSKQNEQKKKLIDLVLNKDRAISTITIINRPDLDLKILKEILLEAKINEQLAKNEEILSSLNMILLKDSELEILKSVYPSICQPESKSENFLVLLLEVPNSRENIQGLYQIIKCENSVREIQKIYLQIHDGINIVKNNPFLKCLLQTTLELGNALNVGYHDAKVNAFELESFLKVYFSN